LRKVAPIVVSLYVRKNGYKVELLLLQGFIRSARVKRVEFNCIGETKRQDSCYHGAARGESLPGEDETWATTAPRRRLDWGTHQRALANQERLSDRRMVGRNREGVANASGELLTSSKSRDSKAFRVAEARLSVRGGKCEIDVHSPGADSSRDVILDVLREIVSRESRGG